MYVHHATCTHTKIEFWSPKDNLILSVVERVRMGAKEKTVDLKCHPYVPYPIKSYQSQFSSNSIS
jgi:hypothetical protein